MGSAGKDERGEPERGTAVSRTNRRRDELRGGRNPAGRGYGKDGGNDLRICREEWLRPHHNGHARTLGGETPGMGKRGGQGAAFILRASLAGEAARLRAGILVLRRVGGEKERAHAKEARVGNRGRKTMPTDFNYVVGGEAGQGVQSVGLLLGKVFTRSGYHVFADQDYESRIRGGHNFFRVRVKDSWVGAVAEPVDILVALNQESVELHQKELAERGIIVFGDEKAKGSDGPNLFGGPLASLAEEKSGNRIMANTVALGAALGLVGYDLEIMDGVLRDQFGEGEIGQGNIKAARAGD